MSQQDAIRPLLVRRATGSGLYGFTSRGAVWRVALVFAVADWKLVLGWGAGRERGGYFSGFQLAWTGSPSYHIGWGWERSLPWRPWPYTHYYTDDHWTLAWAGFFLGRQPPGWNGRHPNDNHRRGWGKKKYRAHPKKMNKTWRKVPKKKRPRRKNKKKRGW